MHLVKFSIKVNQSGFNKIKMNPFEISEHGVGVSKAIMTFFSKSLVNKYFIFDTVLKH